MYAVIKTGGKQYRVVKDTVLSVEKLAGEAGSHIDLDQVLMIGDDKSTTVGTPVIEGATVSAEVVKQERDNKIIVFKKKRRKNYRRTKGHRQDLTVLRIIDINFAENKPSNRASADKSSSNVSEQPDKNNVTKSQDGTPKTVTKRNKTRAKTTTASEDNTKTQEKQQKDKRKTANIKKNDS